MSPPPIPDDYVPISGNTFPVKEQLKALGGRWDGTRQRWFVPPAREAEAKAVLAKAPPPQPRRGGGGGMRGELWQPCRRCDNEPSCVNCELCERHCNC